MKGIVKGSLVGLFVVAFGLFFISSDAEATSQWGKKYGMSCNTCHTAFPRLTYMGEKFMRDGYQFNEDGNDKKQKVSKRLFLDELKHLFGIRLNLRPVEYVTNGITENGVTKDHLTVGRTNWVQFFVAGSLYKNVSIFIENEINDEGEAHFSWYKMGFHNLFGPQGAANVYIGQQAPMEWMPASGRLRAMPDSESIGWGPKSSAGNSAAAPLNAEDSVGLTGSRPAVSFYGYQGPIVYFAGISPGDGAGSNDINNEFNYWVGGRVELTGGTLAGSAVGLFAMQGTDAANTVAAQFTNDYDRYSVQGVLRMGAWDITAALTLGSDDEWTLSGVGDKQEFASSFAQAAYLFGSNSQYYGTLRYMKLDYDKNLLANSADDEQVAASIWYFPMENLKVGLNALIDMEAPAGVQKVNTYHVTIRTMF